MAVLYARGTSLLLPLSALVAGSGMVMAARAALLVKPAALAALALRDNQLLSLDPDGRKLQWLPSSHSCLFARLAWLELVNEENPRQRHILLLTDLPWLSNLPAEDFRRLRVWLRVGARYH